jgi:hypothetical protein
LTPGFGSKSASWPVSSYKQRGRRIQPRKPRLKPEILNLRESESSRSEVSLLRLLATLLVVGALLLTPDHEQKGGRNQNLVDHSRSSKLPALPIRSGEIQYIPPSGVTGRILPSQSWPMANYGQEGEEIRTSWTTTKIRGFESTHGYREGEQPEQSRKTRR